MAWAGEEKCMRIIHPPIPIHPDVEANLQMNDFVGCAQNMCGWRQNSVVSIVLNLKQHTGSSSDKVNALSSLSVSASTVLKSTEAMLERELKLQSASSAVSVSAADC